MIASCLDTPSFSFFSKKVKSLSSVENSAVEYGSTASLPTTLTPLVLINTSENLLDEHFLTEPIRSIYFS